MSDDIKEMLSKLSPEEYDTFLQILSEMEDNNGSSDTLQQLYDEDYEEIPVSIDEFIENPKYAGWYTNNGKDIYPYWRNHLRKMFDPAADYSEVAISGCLTGDTMIPLMNGRLVSMSELSEIDKLDEYVYSFDVESNRYVAGHLVDAFTTGVKPVYRVTLDNGESFKATSNHRFMTRDKHWKSIDSGLSVGDSLMPLYRDTDDRGYEVIKHPQKDGSYISEPTHRMSMRSKRNSSFKGTVHHKDFDKRNNDPRNLVLTTWVAHTLYHRNNGLAVKKYMSTPEGKELAIRNISKFNQEYKEGTASYDSIRRLHDGQIRGIVSRWSDSNEHLKISKITSERMKNGFSKYMSDIRWSDPEQHSKVSEQLSEMNRNPELSSQWQINKAVKIANIAINEYGCLNEEVYQKVKIERNMRSGYPSYKSVLKRVDSSELYDLAINYNHRIVSIDYVGEERVYDLTVEKYHNFVIGPGIVAHNSIGTGKSSITILALAYSLYRLMCLRDAHSYYNIAKGGYIYIVFFNATLALSQGVAYTKFQSLLQNSPWFLERGKVTGTKYLEYVPNKPIRFTVGSQMEHSIGKDIIFGILDEVNFVKGANVSMEKSKIMHTYGCLHSNTLVRTPDGNIAIGSLVNTCRIVYQNNPNGTVSLADNILALNTKTSKDFISIELEDGSIIKVTPDHKFKLSNGSYKEAMFLTEDDVLAEEINFNNIFDISIWRQFNIESEYYMNLYLRWMRSIYCQGDRGLDQYEKHHIMPVSLMINPITIKLTYREHFVAHRILARCFSGEYKRKMIYSLHRMCHGKHNVIDKNSKTYEHIKSVVRRAMSEHLKGRVISEETKAKMRANHADFSGSNHPSYGKVGELCPNYGKIAVHRGELNRYIAKEDLDKYLDEGYEQGLSDKALENIRSSNIGRVHINKDGVEKSVKMEDLDLYLSQGYSLGSIVDRSGENGTTYGKSVVNRDGIIRFVRNEDLDSYIEDGYKLGTGIAPHNIHKICMNKDGHNIFVDQDNIEYYLDNGYDIGMIRNSDLGYIRGKKLYYNPDTNETKYFDRNSVPDGWILGDPGQSIRISKYIYRYKDKEFYGRESILTYLRSIGYSKISSCALTKLVNGDNVRGYEDLKDMITKYDKDGV